MYNFSVVLKTEQGSLNFYINEINTDQGIRFHVSAVGLDRKAVIFQMKKNGNDYVLVNPATCPQWIVDLEIEIAAEISNQMKTRYQNSK